MPLPTYLKLQYHGQLFLIKQFTIFKAFPKGNKDRRQLSAQFSIQMLSMMTTAKENRKNAK